jgi:hypothetical protein
MAAVVAALLQTKPDSAIIIASTLPLLFSITYFIEQPQKAELQLPSSYHTFRQCFMTNNRARLEILEVSL